MPTERRPPRLAAGRARALGQPTRGTTNPNRLRRMDAWIAHRLGAVLRQADEPLVVDLGYGASAVTVIELAGRLARITPSVRVLGLEIDPARVAAAEPSAKPPRLQFARGGFELAGHRPTIVRAANVLRQYDEAAAGQAWQTMQANLAAGGFLVEGTCDELGRLGAWVLLDGDRPLSLTFSVRTESLGRPAELAARLPKALIHHNVPGNPVHALIADLDRAWRDAAPVTAFGPRQRWVAACESVSHDWAVLDRRARWRLGEFTVDWSALDSF